jgi:amino acid transporter
MTGVLIVGSLANVGVTYFLLAIGADGIVENEWAVKALTVALIIVMTAICVIGTELSARVQDVLILAQVLALLAFAVVAIVSALNGTSTLDATTPEFSWLNPFGAGGSALTSALLLGVFAYWGWESAVNLNEETEGASSTPGRAAIASTVVLLVTYVGVAIAVLAYAGVDFLAENAAEEEAIFGVLADEVMGGWSWVVLLAVSTSAIASSQTTIIPASRTGLSMARRHALPHALARIHPRFRTPNVSTWTVAVIAIAWFLVVDIISENALFDSLTALSLLIAFYYGLTGLACAIYYRRELTKSVKNFALIGVGPVIGAILLFWLLVEAIIDMSDPENSYTGVAWFGLGPPLVIGIAIFVVGLLFMLFWRIKDGRFWQERPSVADPVLAAGGRRPTTDPEDAR